MEFKNYFTVKLYPDTESIPTFILLGRAWQNIHRAAARLNIPFAVAFPGWMQEGFTIGNQIRIFTETPVSAEKLKNQLQETSNYSDIAYESEIHSISKHISGLELYLMHRIPPANVSKNRRGERFEEAKELQDRLRLKRLAEQRSLPFVPMSSSTGNKFKLVIERKICLEPSNGVPNGYGLSRATQLITLPIIP